MIVVDTNIIVYYSTAGTMTARADHLMASDPDWRSPELWRSEMRNFLAGELRRGRLSQAEIGEAMEKAETRMRYRHDRVATAWVLPLIAASPCSAYNLEFIALATHLQVPLYTMDRQLLQIFPEIALPLA